MIESGKISSNRPYWFVAARGENRLERFVEEGYWQLFEDETGESMMSQYSKDFNSMEVGDNIAIKYYGTAKKTSLTF